MTFELWALGIDEVFFVIDDYGIRNAPHDLPAHENQKHDVKSLSGPMLSEQDVVEFAAMWEEAYGERLSTHEVKARAEQLVRFVLLMQRMGS